MVCARALCTLCIDVFSGAQVVSRSGHDLMTVPYKQEVMAPPDARCTARHLQVLARPLTAPRCTSGADPGERVVEQSHQPAVQGDALHHWSSGSTTVPPCSAAGALDVPRLPACLRGRPSPEGAPGGTFGSIPQDWDMISKIRAHHLMHSNELSSASAKLSSSDAVQTPFSTPANSSLFY